MPARSPHVLMLVALAAGACSHSAQQSPRDAAVPSAAPVTHFAPPARQPPRPRSDYPPTRRDDVVEQIHGVVVHDPYRWLEDPSAPEVRDWMAAQDAHARDHLASLPGRDALAARLAEVFYYDERDAPVYRGGRYFFLRKHKDREKAIVYWRAGEHGQERVLLDPNTWSSDGSASLREFWPSSDGRHVAFTHSEHNADEATLGVIDVARGELLPETIPGADYAGVSWATDRRGFYYTWLPPPSDRVSVADRTAYAEIRFHALGSDPARDPVVYEATGDARTFLAAHASADGHWLFVALWHGSNAIDLYFQDLRRREPAFRVLVAGAAAHFDVDAFRDVFYVRSNEGAPHYRVFAVDPRAPDRARWKEIVAETEATLDSLDIVGGRLLLNYLHNAVSEIELHDLQGALLRKIELPPIGAVTQIVGQPGDNEAFVTYTSFSVPQAVYRLSVRRGTVTEWARVALPVDTAQITTEQVRYPSSDGTEITMFLVHRKDAVPTGSTPTYLTGYGGFQLSALPGYVSSRSSWGAHAVWLEHGGMIAVPNLRGGGEYGETWHQAGMLLEKQHSFDDFLAAARWLETSGWTSPEHLAISGGSNGGLLVGAAMTQAPELFKAVVCEVPLLDMVRYDRFGLGKLWIPEYGSADDPAQFHALYAYSPYHRVQRRVRYPAVLMSSSDHDDRVDPMHARKFVAALQWATASDAPVWLRIQRNAGHSGSDQVNQMIEQNADSYAFLMWQLGME